MGGGPATTTRDPLTAPVLPRYRSSTEYVTSAPETTEGHQRRHVLAGREPRSANVRPRLRRHPRTRRIWASHSWFHTPDGQTTVPAGYSAPQGTATVPLLRRRRG